MDSNIAYMRACVRVYMSLGVCIRMCIDYMQVRICMCAKELECDESTFIS